MAYLFAYHFVSMHVRICLTGCLANVLNAMEMDGRVKGKVIVNDELMTVSSVKG